MGPGYRRARYISVHGRTKGYHALSGVWTVLLLSVFLAPSTVPGPWKVPVCLFAQSCPTVCDPMRPCQTPLSMGFSRHKYWSGLPCPPPGDLPDPGIKPTSPALAGRFFTTELSGYLTMHRKVPKTRLCVCSAVSDSLQPHGLWPARILCPWDFPSKNTRADCHFLLQQNKVIWPKMSIVLRLKNLGLVIKKSRLVIKS